MNNNFRQDLLYTAHRYYNGIFYRWGGNHPETGLDCSGFVQSVLRARVFPGFTEFVDRNSQMMYDMWDAENMVHHPDHEWFQPGNIFFFGKKPHKAHHIAFYFGYDPDGGEHLLLDAGRGGSAVTTILDAYLRGAKVCIRPMAEPLEFHDLIGIVDLIEAKEMK